MKNTHIWVAIFLAGILSRATAQQSGRVKAPLGVPADAQHFSGKWYRVYLEKIPWNSAKQKCATLGGQLVLIQDQPTWDFIRQMSKGAMLWAGGTDEETQRVWKWADGTPFTFTAWLPSQPDSNFGGQEHYLHITKDGWNDCRNSGVINDRERVAGFICEWKGR